MPESDTFYSLKLTEILVRAIFNDKIIAEDPKFAEFHKLSAKIEKILNELKMINKLNGEFQTAEKEIIEIEKALGPLKEELNKKRNELIRQMGLEHMESSMSSVFSELYKKYPLQKYVAEKLMQHGLTFEQAAYSTMAYSDQIVKDMLMNAKLRKNVISEIVKQHLKRRKSKNPEKDYKQIIEKLVNGNLGHIVTNNRIKSLIIKGLTSQGHPQMKARTELKRFIEEHRGQRRAK